MQMTTEARAWLHATVQRILARHPVADAERAGLTYELMSHLHAVGEERAAAAGRSEVTLDDLAAAHAKAGGDEGLAAAFVRAVAKPLERAALGARLGAFILDVLVVGVGLLFVHGTVVFFLAPGADWTGDTSGHDGLPELYWLVPWAYHDPGLPWWVQGAIAAASAGLVLGYFTFAEAQGASLGKRALGLRVLRADGQPMTARAAFLRNVVKLSPPFLVVDALVLLLASPDARQRGSDRIAQTIVVRT